MKRLSQSGSSNFCLELRKNALLISQSHFSNFALHVIIRVIAFRILIRFLETLCLKAVMLYSMLVFSFIQYLGYKCCS